MARKWKILEILTRTLKIFKGSHKDLVGSLKILQRFSPGMYHNKSKNIESARRIGTFFRCFGSHFGNLARHFKVGNSNVIYCSVHVNTLVIKSAVHCLQLCTIIMMGNFVRRFPLAEKSFHLIQFYPGFTFPLAFKSNNNLHDLYFLPIALCCFCNHTFGHAP